MKRLDSNVGSLEAALQQRPEVLKAVRVDAPVNVPLGMVDELMHEFLFEFVVGHKIVGIDSGAVFDVAEDFVLQDFAAGVRDNLSADLAERSEERRVGKEGRS